MSEPLHNAISRVDSEIKEISNRIGYQTFSAESDATTIILSQDPELLQAPSFAGQGETYKVEMQRLRARLEQDLHIIDDLFEGKVLCLLFFIYAFFWISSNI